MNGPDEALKLDELAERAEVAPRTVRYYVQRGLLPAPIFRGKDTAYGRGHLVRLRAIKRLQAQYLPLDAIQAALEGRSDDEIEALGVEATPGVPAPSSGAGAPGVSPPTVGAGPGGETAGDERAGGCAPRPRAYERWQLAPGLELHLEVGASEEVRAFADEIVRALGARRSGGAGE